MHSPNHACKIMGHSEKKSFFVFFVFLVKNNIDFHRNNTDYNHSVYSTAYNMSSHPEMRCFCRCFSTPCFIYCILCTTIAKDWKNWLISKCTTICLSSGWPLNSLSLLGRRSRKRRMVIVDHSALSTLHLLCFNLDGIQNKEEVGRKCTGGGQKSYYLH